MKSKLNIYYIMKHLTTYEVFLITESKKYEHINFIPPKTVSNQAKRGLKYKLKNRLTKDELSVKIAKKLIKRDKLTPGMIKQISSHFSRMKNREVDAKYKKEPWKDSKYINYLLWGGESGRTWAERVRTQIAKADKK